MLRVLLMLEWKGGGKVGTHTCATQWFAVIVWAFGFLILFWATERSRRGNQPSVRHLNGPSCTFRLDTSRRANASSGSNVVIKQNDGLLFRPETRAFAFAAFSAQANAANAEQKLAGGHSSVPTACVPHSRNESWKGMAPVVIIELRSDCRGH